MINKIETDFPNKDIKYKNLLENCSQNENKIEKKTRKRLCKCEKYGEERVNIIKKLNIIIGLNEKKTNVKLYELEENKELKKELKELIPEIKKYYRTCSWGYFSKEEKKGMGNEIGLLKALYKNEGYNILTKRKTREYNGKKKLESEIYFIKN